MKALYSATFAAGFVLGSLLGTGAIPVGGFIVSVTAVALVLVFIGLALAT